MAYLQRTISQDTVICSVDVGNATSSISFLYTKAGNSLKSLKSDVYRVERWPGYKGLSPQVPSRLCYDDLTHQPVHYGWNAKLPRNDQETWFRVQDLKQHINSLKSNDLANAVGLEGLPDGVSLHQVYRDWVAFLFKTGSEVFRRSDKGSGIDAALWKKRICVFVVSNGWSEPEHAHLRTILHEAQCVTDCHSVRFARESEADLHYGLLLGRQEFTSERNLSFFVCNAGTSTADLGFYKVTSVDPLLLEEVKPARSFNVGSIVEEEFIDESEIEEPGEDESDDEDNMDPVFRVVKNVNELREQVLGIEEPKYIILTGACGRDDHSRKRISEKLSGAQISVINLAGESSSSLQPTVNGALFSGLHNFITARKSVYHFGSTKSILYRKNIPEHVQRARSGLHYINGRNYLPHAWHPIVSQGERVRDGEARQKTLTKVFRDRPSGIHPLTVVLYASKDINPLWVFESHGDTISPGVQEICKITANIDTEGISIDERLVKGEKSYIIKFAIDINFGSVTSTAEVSWKKIDGTEVKIPATFDHPEDTNAEWETKDRHGDAASEESQPGNEGNTNTPDPSSHRQDDGSQDSSSSDSDSRAKIYTGRYAISNPGAPPGNELPQAYWNKLQRSLRCRKSTRKEDEQWYIESGNTKSFKIEPDVGGPEQWVREKRPTIGHSPKPSDGEKIQAWLPGGSTVWYAMHAQGNLAGEHRYYIRSSNGGLAWSVEAGSADARFLNVVLRQWDPQDHNQVWKISSLDAE